MVIVIVFVTVVALWFLCSLVILVWLVRSYRLITLVKIKENIFCIAIVKYVWYWSRTIFIKYIFPISKKLIFSIPHEQIFLRAGCAMWKGEAGTAGCWKKKAGKLNIVLETFWHAPIILAATQGLLPGLLVSKKLRNVLAITSSTKTMCQSSGWKLKPRGQKKKQGSAWTVQI